MILLRVHGVPMPQGSKTAFVRGNRVTRLVDARRQTTCPACGAGILDGVHWDSQRRDDCGFDLGGAA